MKSERENIALEVLADELHRSHVWEFMGKGKEEIKSILPLSKKFETESACTYSRATFGITTVQVYDTHKFFGRITYAISKRLAKRDPNYAESKFFGCHNVESKRYGFILLK
jgi:hypothetical protein